MVFADARRVPAAILAAAYAFQHIGGFETP